FREFARNALTTAAFSRCSKVKSSGNGEVPCILPCYQGNRGRDEFARDCLLQRGGSNEPSSGTRDAVERYLEAYVGDRAIAAVPLTLNSNCPLSAPIGGGAG